MLKGKPAKRSKKNSGMRIGRKELENLMNSKKHIEAFVLAKQLLKLHGARDFSMDFAVAAGNLALVFEEKKEFAKKSLIEETIAKHFMQRLSKETGKSGKQSSKQVLKKGIIYWYKEASESAMHAAQTEANPERKQKLLQRAGNLFKKAKEFESMLE